MAVGFETEAVLVGTVGALEAALTDPEFPDRCARAYPTVEAVSVLEQGWSQHWYHRRWRWRASAPWGGLVVPRSASPWLEWDECWTYDAASRDATWSIVPAPRRDPAAPWRARFCVGGVYSLRVLDEGRVARRVTGEVQLPLGLLSRRAERRASRELHGVYETEALILEAMLAE